MENGQPEEDLYTDVMLELLCAYYFDKMSKSSNLSGDLMELIREDPVMSGEGLLHGLIFSSVIHMSLMITLLATVMGRPREEVLRMYSLAYQNSKEEVARMPQVHPKFVNELAERINFLF